MSNDIINYYIPEFSSRYIITFTEIINLQIKNGCMNTKTKFILKMKNYNLFQIANFVLYL